MDRFHADPRMQATELLLQERVPREAILSEPRPAETATAPPSLPVFASRRFLSPQTHERAHALSLERALHHRGHQRGRRLQPVARPGGDAPARRSAPRDAGAHFIYLRDPWSGRVWSATHQPVCHTPDRFEATFDLDKITFRRRDGDIETQLDITVSSEDDVEVRRLTITNRGAADPRARGHELRRDRAGPA